MCLETYEQETQRTRALPVLLVLLTSFITVTTISPLLRWLFSPPVDALIALSVLGAFACYPLVEFGARRISRATASVSERP